MMWEMVKMPVAMAAMRMKKRASVAMGGSLSWCMILKCDLRIFVVCGGAEAVCTAFCGGEGIYLDEVCIEAFAEDELAYNIARLRDEPFIGGVVVAVEDNFNGAGIALVDNADGVCVREWGVAKAGIWY